MDPAREAPPECPITGVRLRRLAPHDDSRGSLVEVFSEPWEEMLRPVHWVVFRSRPNVLRGVRVHVVHTDYLVLLSGRLQLGLSDLRDTSPTHGVSWLLDLREDAPLSVAIPPGVAHGEYFPVASTHLHGSSHLYDPRDDVRCRWDDPGLGIPWECSQPMLSEPDRECGDLALLREELRRAASPRGAGRHV
jgi:dTDP-4-dehydrorhamnose 3,5-epimerase